MKKIIRLNETDLTRIVRRVISEGLATDLSKLGFEKWGKGYILRLPKGSTPQNDIIRITAQHVTGPDKFLVSVMVNGNAKMRSEIKNGITVFRDVQSTFGAKLIRQDDKFESVSGEITGYELQKLVKKLSSLKYDPKNNIFTIG